MKSIEFMYWLQGYFEVCDCEKLTTEQLKKVKNHLKMVEITDGKELWPFCSWLQGFLVAIEDNDITVKQTQNIKNKLNSIFEHIVEEKINMQNPRGNGQRLDPSNSNVLIKC